MGDVWVRAQAENGRWLDGQTLNHTSVTSFFGGLGITWTVSDTIGVAYGGEDTHIYLVASSDAGARWGAPEDTGLRGRVISLKSDAAGTLYLLALVDGPGLNSDPHDSQYGYAVLARRQADGRWTVSARIAAGLQYSGDLALVDVPGGSPRVYALLTDWDRRGGLFPSTVTLATSIDGGQTWAAHPLNDGARVASEAVVATSVVAAQRSDGSILVAGAWSQTPGPGPAAGAVQARVSLDGDASWGSVETIAQHRSDGRFSNDLSDPSYLGGFEPSLAYDVRTDRIAASWVEDDLSRRDDRAASSSYRSVRTLLAARSLEIGAAWDFTVTPDGAPDTPPQFTTWGLRGALWGTPDGRWQ